MLPAGVASFAVQAIDVLCATSPEHRNRTRRTQQRHPTDRRSDSGLRERLRTSFPNAVIPGLTRADVPEQARAVFRALSRQLASSIDHDAPEQVRQCVSIVAQSATVLDALPTLPAAHSIPADAWRSVSARDEAMAENALAVLAHAQGKSILVFAHTSHILNAPILGGRWSGQRQPPESMGEILHRSLGSHYLAIAQIEPVTPGPSNPPPDLVQLLHPECEQPCMVPAKGLQSKRVRIGINGDDQEFIDPATAADFYLIVPAVAKAAD